MAWNEENIAVLRELYALGMPTRRIAAELGMTKNQVIGKAAGSALSILTARRLLKFIARRTAILRRRTFGIANIRLALSARRSSNSAAIQ
jgi:hypothetical protein